MGTAANLEQTTNAFIHHTQDVLNDDAPMLAPQAAPPLDRWKILRDQSSRFLVRIGLESHILVSHGTRVPDSFFRWN